MAEEEKEGEENWSRPMSETPSMRSAYRPTRFRPITIMLSLPWPRMCCELCYVLQRGTELARGVMRLLAACGVYNSRGPQPGVRMKPRIFFCFL